MTKIVESKQKEKYLKQNLYLFGVFGYIAGTQSHKRILTGTITLKFVFYRDFKSKRLRNTVLEHWFSTAGTHTGSRTSHRDQKYF